MMSIDGARSAGRGRLLLGLPVILLLAFTAALWPQYAMQEIEFAPHGRQLATSLRNVRSRSPEVGLFELSTGRLLARLPIRAAAHALETHPAGKLLLVGNRLGEVEVLDMRARLRVRHWRAGRGAILRVRCVGSGERLVTLAGDGRIALWSLRGRKLDELSSDIVASDLDAGPEGELVAVANSAAQRTELYQASTDRFVRILTRPAGDRLVALSHGSGMLVAADGTQLAVVNLHRRAPPVVFPFLTLPVALAAHPVQPRSATSGRDLPLQVYLWKGDNPGAARRVEPIPRLTRRLAFSPDGRLLAGAADRGPVTLWDVGTGRIVGYLRPASPAWAIGLASVLLFALWLLVWVRRGLVRPSRLRAWIDLVLVYLAVLSYLGVQIWAAERVTIESPVALAVCAVLASGFGLLMAWFLLGGLRWSLRISPLIAGVAVLWGLATHMLEPPVAREILPVSVLLVTCFASSLIVMRTNGVRLTYLPDNLPAAPEPAGQWRLRDLLLLMAAVSQPWARPNELRTVPPVRTPTST